MQCVSVWEKKKIALKHSIIYVPAASVPQPLLLERGRERERGNTQGSKRQERTPVCWSTALLAFLRGERQRTTSLLLLHPCVCVCVWERLVDTAAVLALAGDLCSIFQNAQQPHWMRRGRWGTQQSGWVVWSCNWECVCRWWANVPFYRSLVMGAVQAVVFVCVCV